MYPRPILALFGFMIGWLMLPPLAAADPLTAEALFREGRRLLDAGRIDEACTKLAESQAQDPASGTLINLALCYEKQGKFATAWATYLAAGASARMDGRADRVLSAEQKGSEVEPRVPRLVFQAAQPVAGMVITWGKSRGGLGALGSAIPVDPGSYQIEVSAKGFEPWTQTVTLGEGESRVVEIPPLHRAPSRDEPTVMPSQPPAQGALSSQLPRTVPPSEAPTKSESSWLLPVTLGAAGIVTVATGTYFGFRSLSQYAEAERSCPTHHDCEAAAMDSWRHAKTSAWVANIGLPLGAAALAVSGWLVLSRTANRPRVGMAVGPAGNGSSIEFGLEL